MTTNGVSSQIIAAQLLVPRNSNTLSVDKRLRSFDCGRASQRANLLESDSSSVGNLTTVYPKERNMEIGKPDFSKNSRWELEDCKPHITCSHANKNNYMPIKSSLYKIQLTYDI